MTIAYMSPGGDHVRNAHLRRECHDPCAPAQYRCAMRLM